MSTADASVVAASADAAFDATLEQLNAYLRYPAISCLAAHAADVRALAARIRDDLEALGMDQCRVLELPNALPCVAAQWMGAGPDAPVVLIYGHFDLQPVVRKNWHSDPHEPEVRDGRLYGRGSADDMGGWMSHFAAIDAWMKAGGLPCNVRLLIEGEEEIGSPNLERFMDAYPQAFKADVMVLTDCENPSTEVPGLTVSLRGLLELDLTCEALHADGHSGLWGGIVPDVSIALCRLIARLTDDDGRMAVGRVEVDDAWRRAAWDVPLDDLTIREGAHLIDGVDPIAHRGTAPAEWMWRQPSITVISTTLPRPEEQKNALRSAATATLSVRLAPGQTAAEMLAAMQDVLLVNPPGGVKVSLNPLPGSGESWLYEPQGVAFEAVDRAYEKSWGCKPVQVGVGGSIPFVALFGRRFSDLPLILNGVMDPRTTAHGPNESMDLGVFRKAIAANVYLYDELSQVLSR